MYVKQSIRILTGGSLQEIVSFACGARLPGRVANGREKVLLMQFVSNELVREFTSVYESWPDCLNQDLLDFLDFRDVACLLVRRWLDECL